MIEYMAYPVAMGLFGWLVFVLFLSYSENPVIPASQAKDKTNCWKVKCADCDAIGYQKKDYFHGFELSHGVWLCDLCNGD